MDSRKFITSIFLIIGICFGCSTSQHSDNTSIYFRSFNLFTLSGRDTLPTSAADGKQNPDFVKVTYENKLPHTITYHFADREVVLKLDNSFKFNDRNVFVYYTGNLLGGKAGKQREYSFHYIDNGYKLYIDLSDTILVKSYDNIDLKSNVDYHYMLDVYSQEGNKINRYSLLQGDTKKTKSNASLYKYWSVELKSFKPEVVSHVALFPPK